MKTLKFIAKKKKEKKAQMVENELRCKKSAHFALYNKPSHFNGT